MKSNHAYKQWNVPTIHGKSVKVKTKKDGEG